jgi:disease resistance protein RPM1
MEDIAISCSRRPDDVVYEMIPLDETDSKSLFCNSVYVQEEEWPDHFKESSKKMFEVCGGLPLAIIATAGFLGRTSAELSLQSEKLNKIILSESDQFYSESQGMRKILDISFADLPLPLKSCFLYLTAFSGNYDIIKKDRLVRRWVAEGLIPERHGKSSWETGESYFDELISRRLIQPVFDGNDDQPVGCTVHGVAFDFLESLSFEENFITPDEELKSGLFPCETVRRVSLDCGDEDEGDTLISNTYCLFDQKSLVSSSCAEEEEEDDAIFLQLSRVRSLAVSGDAGRRIPDLSAFKHLRLLDLEDTKGLDNKRLEGIGHLCLLRYLGLGGTDVTKLPQQIMALEQLATLDLRRTRVRRLPALCRDTKLVSLLADELAITPREMRRMQNLEELSKVLMGPDGSLASELAVHVTKLGPLRMLGIRFSHMQRHSAGDRQGVMRLLEELRKSNLQSLLLDNYPHPLLGLLVDLSTHNLRKFELRIRGCLPQVPQEIASLTAVTHLHINVEAVEAQGVRALGSLPNLVVLRLDLNSSPSMTVSSNDGFQCLKSLWCNSQYGGGKGMQFEAGAMPQLRRLRLELDARGTRSKHDDFDIGIQHLPSLVHVHATIDWTNTALTASEVEAAENQIREQVSRSPNNTVLELNRRRQRYIAKPSEELVITVNSLQEWGKQIDPRKLVVVHFSAVWCRSSRKMSPVFADLAKKFRNVVFLKVDVDEMETVAKEFSVEGVPTFLFMKGGYVKDRVVGADKEELGEVLEEQLT